MINFEYGVYSFEYNEFQHKLEVRCDDEEVLFDAPNFDLSKMSDIYDQLNSYFNIKYHANKLGEVLDEIRKNYLSLQKVEETEEIYEFLKEKTYYELNELKTLLGSDEDDEE